MSHGKNQMSCECHPHAVVILNVTPDNGVKPEGSKLWPNLNSDSKSWNCVSKKNLTQEHLVELCEVSPRTIQRIESGEVDPRAYPLHCLGEALASYNLDVARLRLIMNDVNGIFRIDAADGSRFILRVTAPEGGHGIDHVAAEMDWLAALARDTDLSGSRAMLSAIFIARHVLCLSPKATAPNCR